LISSDIKIKYKNSALGMVWSMIAPAMQIGIYFLVFQIILKNGVPDYVIMLWSGMLVWHFFTNVVSNATSVVVQRAGIVKKVAFPREILALTVVGTSMVYFSIQFGVLAVLMLLMGHAPAWHLLWLLPMAFLGVVLIASALGIFFSAINVYFRDTSHMVDVGINLWFWLTPIVYSYERTVSPMLHSHGLAWLYLLNPVTPVVLTFQRVLYGETTVIANTPDHSVLHVLPGWTTTTFATMNGALIAAGALLLLGAMFVFGRLQGNFAEEL
jgi:ABC-2 type transport system permease protein